MATSNANILTTGYSAITEDIRSAIFLAADPGAPIDVIEEVAPHNDRTWTHYGLENGENYIWKMQKKIAPDVWEDFPGEYFTFTAGGTQAKARKSEVIQFGVTPGIPAGVNTITVADWIGWDIYVRRGMSLDLIEDAQVIWDKTTGELTLLTEGDLFMQDEYARIVFEPIITESTNSTAYGRPFSTIKIITASEAVVAADFGKNALIKGAGSYLEVTLPIITDVPVGKMLYIESGIGNHITAKIKTAGVNVFDWKEGNRDAMYICRCENMAIYREQIDAITNVWRVLTGNGNFMTVGRQFYSDKDTEFNALELDGGGVDGLNHEEYARLYYDYVALLPFAQVCAYEDWGTGDNKYKFSLKNTEGKFRIPDRRGQFMRHASADRAPGIKQVQAFPEHDHFMFGNYTGNTNLNGQPLKSPAWTSNHSSGNQDYDMKYSNDATPSIGKTGKAGSGTDLHPENIAVRAFINI